MRIFFTARAALLFITLLTALPLHGGRGVVAAQGAAIPDLSRALRWRPIGPSLGGAVTAAQGITSKPGTFHVAVAGAGIWSTTDYGASWQPAFESAPFGDVTALAATRDGQTLYAAMAAGDDAGGSVVFVTTNAGSTWTTINSGVPGRITAAAIEPHGSTPLLVATTSATGASIIHRSADGGRTLTGVAQLQGIVRQIVTSRDRAFAAACEGDTAAGILHSADRGLTWQPAVDGLAAGSGALETCDVSLSPDGRAFLLAGRSGTNALYGFDPSVGRWTLVNADAGAGPRARIAAGPNGLIRIVGSASLVSRDSGVTFVPSPMPRAGGDTFIWTHPDLSDVVMVAGQSGPAISVNDGRTWSDPEALPVARAERIAADAAYPSRVCVTTASRTGCRPIRSGNGAWEWLSVSGPVVSDPQEPDVLIDARLDRYDRRTTQAAGIAWNGLADTAPFVAAFSADGRTLYAAGTSVARTTNSGGSWTDVGADIASAERDGARASAIAVSPVDVRTVWMSFDDGRLLLTRDAATTWTNVTAPLPGATARVIEPSRFDSRSVYVVASATTARGRLLRTRDEGRTWTDIGAGIPGEPPVRVVREDPFRRGLLYAGTDRSVFISYDDGEQWEPLRLNLPAAAAVDIVVKDADVIVATDGRGVWVLDDVSPLRQVTRDVARADLFFFQPPAAWRTRASPDRDDDRIFLTYSLGTQADEVNLDIVETATGDVIRRFSSASPSAGTERPGVTPGVHRVEWDLRYAPPLPNDEEAPRGTRVLPGVYQARLTTGSRVLRQALPVRLDPRVRTPISELVVQRDLGRAVDAARAGIAALLTETPSAPADGDRRRASLEESLQELNGLAAQLQQAELRPSPGLERAVETAVARAAAVAADERR